MHYDAEYNHQKTVIIIHTCNNMKVYNYYELVILK